MPKISMLAITLRVIAFGLCASKTAVDNTISAPYHLNTSLINI